MASGWVKSLKCKSRAVDDVVNTNPKYHSHSLIPTSSSCRKSAQTIKDVIETKPKNKKPQPVSSRPSLSTRRPRPPDPFLPALSELQEGHPSRNVVEIIFHTSWTPKSFSGRIEMIFKVQNLGRTVTRFEEYRERVRSRVDADGECEDHARCVADGNEVMRFHCLGPTSGGAYDACSGALAIHARKGAAICTYSGSGGAHESAGGGRGRRAMLVCRVIAGRVGLGSLLESRVGFDSVSGGNGELLVFDSRAVLPCFLIIYKL